MAHWTVVKKMYELCRYKQLNLNSEGETFWKDNSEKFEFCLNDLGCKDLIETLLGNSDHDILSKFKMHWYINTCFGMTDIQNYGYARGIDLHHVMSREHQHTVDNYTSGSSTNDIVIFPITIDDQGNPLVFCLDYNKIYNGSFSIIPYNKASKEWIKNKIRLNANDASGYYDFTVSLYLEEI